MADYLLNEAGVACISGTSFGEYGEGFLRFRLCQLTRKSKQSADAHQRSGRKNSRLTPGFAKKDKGSDALVLFDIFSGIFNANKPARSFRMSHLDNPLLKYLFHTQAHHIP